MTKNDFRPISLTDRPEINRIFDAAPPEISEYTFSNLFVWRRPRKTRIFLADGGCYIIMEDHGRDVLLPPAGFSDRTAAWTRVLDLFHKDPSLSAIIKIPEPDEPILRNHGLTCVEDRNHFDYLYSAEDLAELKGRKFDGKRWLVRKFEENTEFECRSYEESDREDCLALSRAWTRKKQAEHPEETQGYAEEEEAVHDYLDHLAHFHCCGCVFVSAGRVIAFTFGERLNPTTFVIHFEKADSSYSGVYQAVNRNFVQKAVAGLFPFVNREQDLGIEGIRKAKLSYHPIGFVKKYRIDRPG
jgi:hypothetical protein